VKEPPPVLVYFHFGGCVLGDLDTCHTTCSRLAEEVGAIVISAQYRLAPEHKFPAAVEDAVSAYRWASAHAAELGGDPQRIGVGGDSAGGYLAAAVCLVCRDSAEPAPVLQLLIYPVTDMDRTGMPEGPHDNDYPLSRADMIWFSEQYLTSPAEVENPLCSIGRTASFRGLPPAIVCLAGHDVLREEGVALAGRLEADGVPVVLRIFDTLPHAFTAMCGAIPDARDAVSEIARLLRAAFSRPIQGGGSDGN
jgi:acetyl esterase/lipase